MYVHNTLILNYMAWLGNIGIRQPCTLVWYIDSWYAFSLSITRCFRRSKIRRVTSENCHIELRVLRRKFVRNLNAQSRCSLLAAKASFTRVAAGKRACSHGHVMLLYMYAHVPNLTIKSPYRTCIYVYVEWQGRERESGGWF